MRQARTAFLAPLAAAARPHTTRTLPVTPGVPLEKVHQALGGTEREFLGRRLQQEQFRGALDEQTDQLWYRKQAHLRKQDSLVEQHGVEGAVREHLTPSVEGYRSELRSRPLNRKVLEELYRELHGKRTERKLRKGFKHEHWVSKGDGTAPVLQGSTKAQHTFGYGGKVNKVVSATTVSDFPVSKLPEVAVVGRTNSGRSSLINAVLNGFVCPYGQLSGTTKTADFYTVGENLMLVDLPGYGPYHTVQATVVAAENARRVTTLYLGQASQAKGQVRNVKRVLLVIAPLGLHRDDEQLMDQLQRDRVPFTLVVAKSDTQPIKLLARVVDYVRSKLVHYSMCHELIVVSALRLAGITRLQNLLAEYAVPLVETQFPIADDFDAIV